MSEDVARAIGAGSDPDTPFIINGKPVKIRPLSVKELAEIERDCVKIYRRKYLEAIKDAMDFLPNGEEELRKAVMDSAKWEADHLPKKFVYDVGEIKITQALKDWLVSTMGVEEELLEKDLLAKRLLATALDQETLTSEEFQKMTGKAPRRLSTGYVNWWCTGDPDGMVSMLYHCARASNPDLTKDDILKEIGKDSAKLTSLSREIEALSSPSLGNG